MCGYHFYPHMWDTIFLDLLPLAIPLQFDTLLHCRRGQKYGRKAVQQNGQANQPKLSEKHSGIINPCDCLTYNTTGAF